MLVFHWICLKNGKHFLKCILCETIIFLVVGSDFGLTGLLLNGLLLSHCILSIVYIDNIYSLYTPSVVSLSIWFDSSTFAKCLTWILVFVVTHIIMTTLAFNDSSLIWIVVGEIVLFTVCRHCYILCLDIYLYLRYKIANIFNQFCHTKYTISATYLSFAFMFFL